MSILWLIILLLPTAGFAWRGIALLLMTKATPGRLVSASGVVAAIAMFVFAVFGPVIVADFQEIFNEFQLNLSPGTSWLVLLADTYLRLGVVVRWLVGIILSICVLLLPEIFFYRRQPGHAGR